MGYVENDCNMLARILPGKLETFYKFGKSLTKTNIVSSKFHFFLNLFSNFYFFILKTVDEWQYSCFALGCLQFTFFWNETKVLPHSVHLNSLWFKFSAFTLLLS